MRTPVAALPEASLWSTATSTNAPPLDHWWTSFESTGLVQTVTLALQQNYDLGQALARIDAAVAQAKIAGADQLPMVGVTYNAARNQSVFVGLPIPGQGDSPLKSLSTAQSLSFNVSWELDVWGRIRAGQQAALANVQATQEDFRGAMSSLAARTAKAWLAAVEARHQRDLAEATVASFTMTARQVRDRYELGLRSALDLRLALNNEAVAKALLAFRRQELQRNVRLLEVLLGEYPSGRYVVSENLPEVPAEIPAGLPSALLERRADLEAAERRLAETIQRVHEAKRAMLPRISLTASGGRTSEDLADLLDSQFSMWTLAANVAQPIFQGGKLRANVELANARARESVDAYRGAVLQAFSEVEIALGSEADLRQRETHLAEARRQSQAALQLAQERYQQGLIEFVTLTESQRSAYNAESELLVARRQRLANRVDLFLALGGGFTEEQTPQMVAKAR